MAKAKKKTANKRSASKKAATKKPTARAAKAKKPPVKKPAPRAKKVSKNALPSVRVRMFRHGLGDCFLITFNVDRDERHMLIDCGTLGNKANSDVDIPAVYDHVVETIGKGKLDIVVATHEHKDHLSGFNGAMKDLKGRVGEVWMAWTENPADPDAQRFAKTKHDLGEALAITVQAFGSDMKEVLGPVTDLLEFAGVDPQAGAVGAAKFAETVHAAMEFVRKGLGAKAHYHEPGDVLEPDWLPGFRFYVLGPSRSPESMKDLGSHASDELYHAVAGLRTAAALRIGTLANAKTALEQIEEQVEKELEDPFDARYEVKGEDNKQAMYPAYFSEGEGWRQVESDWMHLASDLALQLDSMTNNSSLALAIERIADGKVLLFPADAQQGNWLSWHEPEEKFKLKIAGKKRVVTAADLLEQTVFYKTGHHGSHNATARGRGLELMGKRGELTAFVPVDREVALGRNPKDSWQMPARPLYRRLLEKCEGRVARSDTGWAAEAQKNDPTEKEFLGMAKPDEWTKWQKSQKAAEKNHLVKIDPLFIEYTLS